MSVAVVVTARPSYARVQTVLEGLRRRAIKFHVYACASALLPMYGRVVDVIQQDGYQPIEVPASCAHNTLTGTTLTMARLTEALSLRFWWDPPSLVVTIADRKETLATAVVASYHHLPLFHLLAGERSGSIDDTVRDAVSALAQYHAVPCPGQLPVVRKGVWRVTGCPSVDLALRSRTDPPVTCEELGGTGATLNLANSFVVLMQHPVSNEPQAAEQLECTMIAVDSLQTPVLAFWPGEEAGSDASSKILRQLKENYLGNHAWHFVRSCAPRRFYRLLAQCRCLVGNSSVGIREAGALGVPVVDIGTRQTGRLAGDHVVHVSYDVAIIRDAVQAQLKHGPYAPSTLYGDGHAGERVAAWIQEIMRV